ncbi:MAG: right-handed parallel beta-helix repeat-containing protein [Cytophagales bacterium]|nr:right-handed parallel beta-helix repeat-containing protein [Armatimonadota bacterium]
MNLTRNLHRAIPALLAGGALWLNAAAAAHAADLYVSAKGSDTNNGKSAATAFRTLKKAAALVEPGDTVLVGDGEYTDAETGGGSAVLTLSRAGRPGAWITWKAQPGQRPVIRPVGWQGIAVRTSYQVLDGLTVLGNNDSITLIDALKDATPAKDGKLPPPNPRFNTNGIIVEGRQNAPDAKPHHVVIRNCTVSKCAGGGIAAIEADYVTVEDCRIFENAWYSRYGCSGFTTLDNWAFDDAPGYHIIVQRNYVWNNKGLVPWGKIGKLSDGNGIILDVTDQARQGANNPTGDAATAPSATAPAPAAPAKPKRPEWKGRALIANNVSAFNGGSGIHTFRTRYVDIVNNTTYWNGQVVNYEEIFANNSQDVNIMNNVIVPRPGGRVTSNNRNTNVRWDYNLYPAAQTVMTGPHDIVAEPRFVGITSDPTSGGFQLVKNSPGVGSGSLELPLPTNILNRPRSAARNGGRNRGAY